MALTPLITTSFGAGTLVITDSTVYGGDNYARNQVQVSFIVTRITAAGSSVITLPSYDVNTVSSISLEVPDGQYDIEMTISPNDNSTDLKKTTTALMTQTIRKCVKEYRDAFLCRCCDDFNIRAEQYLKLQLAIYAMDSYATDGLFTDARCVLESVTQLCNKC